MNSGTERDSKPAPAEELGVSSGDTSPHRRHTEGLYLDEILEILETVLDDRLSELVASVESRILQAVKEAQDSTYKERLISETELAGILNCDPRTVRRLEKSRLIPRAVRFGGSKRWRLPTIMRWLSRLEEQAA